MSERFVGSRAIWKADGFRELFVTFGEPGGIGMSSIVGLLAPVKRSSPFGRRVIFEPPETAPFRLMAPIAPGLIEPVGIERVETISFDDADDAHGPCWLDCLGRRARSHLLRDATASA